MEQIYVGICDDEPHMLEAVEAKLSDYMKSRGISCDVRSFLNSNAFLQCGQSFDLVFLDIQMEDPDGMETARILRSRGFDGLIIFITVLRECVFDSFEVEAYDYLLKPLEASRFCQTMDRALAAIERRAKKNIIVQRGDACRIVPLSEIVYCEVIGRKVYLHTKNGETVDYYSRLEELEEKVDSRFFRCHRSYLVNLDYVRGLQQGLVSLADGQRIPVSRLRKQQLTETLLVHMRTRRR